MTRLRHLSICSALVTGCALQYVVPDDVVDTDDTDDTANTADTADTADTDDTDGCAGDECTGPDPCALDVCGEQCVDLQVDPANCGLCDRWCDSSAACVDGACVQMCSESCDQDAELCVDGTCECRSGLMRCDDDCVDITSDDDHCGMCGRDCGDLLCNAGECATACNDVLDVCDETCVDFANDPLNCGACERDCHPSQMCIAGECESAS